MKKDVRACVLLSGGLDSLLAVKIMKEQGVEVFSLFFKFPFSKDLENDLRLFSKKEKIHFDVIDCTQGELLKEYLDIIKKPNYGRGAGFNPCIDCKIFLFKKTKDFMQKHKLDFVVSGEVLDERPMSQTKKALNLIEIGSGLEGFLLRPLSSKLLKETLAERRGFVDRDSFFEIRGKRRIKQIELAKKYNLSYPSPAGGCLLCEKNLRKRFKLFFLNENMWKYFYLLNVGRHFFIDGVWIILGRNEIENNLLEKIKGVFSIKPFERGPSALIFSEVEKSFEEKVLELVEAYSKKGCLKKKGYFEKYRI